MAFETCKHVSDSDLAVRNPLDALDNHMSEIIEAHTRWHEVATAAAPGQGDLALKMVANFAIAIMSPTFQREKTLVMLAFSRLADAYMELPKITGSRETEIGRRTNFIVVMDILTAAQHADPRIHTSLLFSRQLIPASSEKQEWFKDATRSLYLRRAPTPEPSDEQILLMHELDYPPNVFDNLVTYFPYVPSKNNQTN